MNLIQILTDHGIEFRTGGSHKNVREGWIGIDCVFCHTKGKFHLGISLKGRHGSSCWTCGTHRLVEVFDALGLSRRLIGDLGDAEAVPVKARGKLRMPYGVVELPWQHRNYLKWRGFDPDELVRLWGIKGIGIAPRLAWSVWIPIVMHGELVTWTTRTIGDVEPKYRSAISCEESMPIKETLYGWDYVRHSVVVVEGPADAWRVGPGAVATHGVNVSDEQIRLLSQVPYRLICFDNDSAGKRRSDELAERLGYTIGETSVCRLDSADAGAATPDEVQELRRWLDGIETDTTAV